MLIHLERHNFPCHRLIKRVGQQVVTEYAEGEILSSECSLSVLTSLGKLLGSLHSLPTSESLPFAKMLPKEELSFAASCLGAAREIRGNRFVDELEADILSFPSFDTLPLNLLHNDIHPGNVVMEQGELTIIDWEGSGRGPAIIDLGFLLSSIYPRGSPVELEERVRAVLEGYTSVRALEKNELHLLLPAIRFRPLVFLSALELQRVRGEQEDISLSRWFLQRYKEAPTIAGLVRKILQGEEEVL